jgi:hexosaminidase
VRNEGAGRAPWRGLTLDVARHFFGVATIKRVIDSMAAYKLNVLHLHLTDDDRRAWRQERSARPGTFLYRGGYSFHRSLCGGTPD